MTNDTRQAAPRLEFPRELAQSLRERDAEALSLFFERFFDPVYRYVRRLVGDEHLAEDLTQDIFMSVHRSLPGYDPEREISPWVFTIATNKVRDHWRSRAHRDSRQDASVERDAAAEHLSAEVSTPSVGTERTELSGQLDDAIAQLSKNNQVAVKLRLYDGLSFEAISQVLRSNEVAVRKRYSRALHTLRGLLEGVADAHALLGA